MSGLHHATAALLISAIQAISSPALAQQYGQNPAPQGFVPLADGPVAPGTTGAANTDADNSLSGDGDTVFLDNDAALVATNVTANNSLWAWFASLGNLDLIFESMTGAQISVQSMLNGSTFTLDVDFTGRLGDPNGTDNPNDIPDANPADDNTNTETNGGFDTSPGNPSADKNR